MAKDKPGAKRDPFEEDAMKSPAVEAGKRKCPSCGQDIMTSPAGEESQHKCPSCGRDIMASPGKE